MGFGYKGIGGTGCKVYGLADYEVFVRGSDGGFRVSKVSSLLKTARVVFMDLG